MRYTFKTESEAWTAVADTLDMIKNMPPKNSFWNCAGLCSTVGLMYRDCLISPWIETKMLKTIRAELRGRGPGADVWLAPPMLWKPRSIIARRFAERAL
jgi:hypothetical protein